MMRALLTLLFTATFVVSPAFTSPFSGFRADQMPIPQVDPPVQPAGYAFAIWGLIYAWLVASALFGLWRRRADSDWNDVRVPLIASLALGTPWLAVANLNAVAATVLIFAMLVTAVLALLRTPARDRWVLRAPVAIYAGWLTAAAFVSFGSVAAGYGIFTDQIGWAYVCIALAAVTAWAVQRRVPGAPEYGLTVVWALVGIVVTNQLDQAGISAVAAIGIAVIGTLALTGRSRAAT